MGIFDRLRWASGATPKSHIIANIVTRALICIVSFVVIGLYARDVDLARKAGASVDGSSPPSPITLPQPLTLSL